MRKASLLVILLLSLTADAGQPEEWQKEAVPASSAKVRGLERIGTDYFIRFEQPVSVQGIEGAVIPTFHVPESKRLAALDIQVGNLSKEHRVYVRIITEGALPDAKQWESMPGILREDIAAIEGALARAGIGAQQCPDGKRCVKECVKNPADCCLWNCK
jgi:hypothetical protein